MRYSVQGTAKIELQGRLFDCSGVSMGWACWYGW